MENKSILDKMKDGKEYLSLLELVGEEEIDFGKEIQNSLLKIMKIRQRPFLCYLANVINPSICGNSSISLDNSDDGPFIDILRTIPLEEKSIDIILVTPGGLADNVDYYVKMLRQRFDHISFILPYMAMSAGTIFCLSGDEIIMSDAAFIGPIDPQVQSANGCLVPAQSIIALVQSIEARGREQIKNNKPPNWTDIEIIRGIDPKEYSNAIIASARSIKLVTEYLTMYKFKEWTKHKDGRSVCDNERIATANRIANLLCNSGEWLSHGNRITRETVIEKCELRVVYPESIQELDKAIRQFWALVRYAMEYIPIVKIFASKDFFLVRNAIVQ